MSGRRTPSLEGWGRLPVPGREVVSEDLPAINSAIKIDDEVKGIHLTVEVAGHMGDRIVRAVAMSATQGLVRGMEAMRSSSRRTGRELASA